MMQVGLQGSGPFNGDLQGRNLLAVAFRIHTCEGVFTEGLGRGTSSCCHHNKGLRLSHREPQNWDGNLELYQMGSSPYIIPSLDKEGGVTLVCWSIRSANSPTS